MRNCLAPSTAAGAVHVASLDGARGLAVLLVLLDHASDAEMRFFAGADLNRLGKYGVYLFFALSAFLLTSQFRSWAREDFLKPDRWANFALRRFLRVYPVYAVVLVAYYFMHKLKPAELLSHLLLQDGKGQFWSIPVEMKFYVLLPFLGLALFGTASRPGWAKAGAWLLTALVAGGVFWAEASWSRHEIVLLRTNIAPFLLGSATALVFAWLEERPAVRARLAPWLQTAALLAFASVLLRTPVIYNHVFFLAAPVKKFGWDSLVCGLLWAVFLLGVLQPGPLARALSWKPLRFLGLISFSAYLWHRKFLSDIDDLPVPTLLRLFVFFAIVIGVATASWLLLERPLSRIRWKRRGPEVGAPSLEVEPAVLPAEI